MKKSNKWGRRIVSVPLFKQSLKANWVLWLVITLSASVLFILVNMVVCSRELFTNVDMDKVGQYVVDQEMGWLSVLGLLSKMGFSLSRIATLSRVDMNLIFLELIYKAVGLVLPMIYAIIVSNNLIAAQVTNGSMAYVLSTPTDRKTVVRTQFVFLAASIAAMYVVITACSVISEDIARSVLQASRPDLRVQKLPLRTLLYCFGSFVEILSIGGICFGASAFFNKSRYSLALGGGACIVSFISCILGIFGHKVLVSFGIGIEEMGMFNYASLFTLLNTESMSDFAKAVAGIEGAQISYDWIWQLGILLVIGFLCAFIGSKRFEKKDLPL